MKGAGSRCGEREAGRGRARGRARAAAAAVTAAAAAAAAATAVACLLAAPGRPCLRLWSFCLAQRALAALGPLTPAICPQVHGLE